MRHDNTKMKTWRLVNPDAGAMRTSIPLTAIISAIVLLTAWSLPVAQVQGRGDHPDAGLGRFNAGHPRASH